ncbi:MAG: cadherin repeat domain-containing protein [Pseudomonadota bacterium]
MASGDGVVNTGGIELHLTNSSGQLTKIVGLKACNNPGQTVAEAQTTGQGEGGQHRYKAAMVDTGPLNAVVGYEPGSATDLLILEHLASRQTRAFKIVEVTEDGERREVTGNLFLTGWVTDEGTLGGERTARLTGRPSGKLRVINTSIAISATQVPEDALAGSTVGVLSVVDGQGSYTFSIPSGGDPDGKFTLDGNALQLADALDYESATRHLITIEADNGVDPALLREIPIDVVNAFEQPDLSALTLPDTVAQGEVITISGATDGSTITGDMPAGWTLDGPGRQITIAAGAPMGVGDWSLTESLDDSSNSARTSSGSALIVDPASTVAPEITYPQTQRGGLPGGVPDDYWDLIAADEAHMFSTSESGGCGRLVVPSSFDRTSVQDGDWSDPATWGGAVPQGGETVKVLHHVKYNHTMDLGGRTWEEFQTERFEENQPHHAAHAALAYPFIDVDKNGSLSFDPTVETTLLVDTLRGMGPVLLGTHAAPIPFTGSGGARLKFMMIGTADPENTMNLGLLTFAKHRVMGTPITEYVYCDQTLFVGDQNIPLTSVPSDWFIGMKVTFGPTTINPRVTSDPTFTGPQTYYDEWRDETLVADSFTDLSQYEQRTIIGIGPGGITIDRPLDYAKPLTTGICELSGETRELKPIIVSEARSILIDSYCTSYRGSGANRRGHTMHAHNDDYVRRFGWISYGGRTAPDATVYVKGYNDETTGMRDAPGGNFIADPNNCIGRYGSHLHLTGPYRGRKTTVDEGMLMTDALVGWQQHHSRSIFKNCVNLRSRFQGFSTEWGSEIGEWDGCVSLGHAGDGTFSTTRQQNMPNHQGHASGFDCQSRAIAMRNCDVRGAWVAYNYWQCRPIANNITSAETGLPHPLADAAGAVAMRMDLRSPEDTSLALVHPFAAGHGDDQTGAPYGPTGLVGHHQVQIPRWEGMICADSEFGFFVSNRDWVFTNDTTPGIFTGCVLQANAPYFIDKYSFHYVLARSMLLGPGNDPGGDRGQTSGITSGVKSHNLTEVDDVVKGFRYTYDNVDLKYAGFAIAINDDSPIFQKERTKKIDGLTGTNHPQNGIMGPWTKVSDDGTDSQVIVRTIINHSVADLPLSVPIAPWAGTDPGGTAPVVGITNNSSALTPNAFGQISFRANLKDSVGLRAMGLRGRFDDAATAPVEISNTALNSNGVIKRNKWFDDNGTRKVRLWLPEVDRGTAAAFYPFIDVPLGSGWDQAFLDEHQVADGDATKPVLPVPMYGPSYSETPTVETEINEIVLQPVQTPGANSVGVSELVRIARLDRTLTRTLQVPPGVQYSLNGGALADADVSIGYGDELVFHGQSGAIGVDVDYSLDIGGRIVSFRVTAIQAVDQVVQMDFGRQVTTIAGWNHLENEKLLGVVHADMVDDTGTATGLVLECLNIGRFDTNDLLPSPSQIPEVPDDILRTYFRDPDNAMEYQIQGLDAARDYQLVLTGFNTRSSEGVTRFTVVGATTEVLPDLTVENNVAEARRVTLRPTAGGTITFQVVGSNGNSGGTLSAAVLKRLSS